MLPALATPLPNLGMARVRQTVTGKSCNMQPFLQLTLWQTHPSCAANMADYGFQPCTQTLLTVTVV